MRGLGAAACIAAFFGLVQMLGGPANAADTPKRGGTVTLVVEGGPPDYDCYAGTSFVVLNYVASHYSTLLRYDTANYPKIVGDVAQSWTVSPDGLSYTFKLHPNVKFHDGTQMTSADVKASYERLRNPPAGVVSVRKSDYADVASIDTPDAQTVVFKMTKANPVMLANFASPWNCIYSGKRLEADQKYPQTNVMGTGAFTFVEYQKGAKWTGKRFDGYFRPGLPYLDGFTAIEVANGTNAVNALSAGQVDATFRLLSPPEIDVIAKARGDKMTFPSSAVIVNVFATFNSTRKPYDDVRVRKALSLAIDRKGNLEPMKRITNLYVDGGLIRPGYEMASSDAQLQALPGLGTNVDANRAEARRLLAEAGQANLTVKLLNRNVNIPYQPLGVLLISEWSKIGVKAEMESLETAQYQSRLLSGDFDVAIDFYGPPTDDPSQVLQKFVPGAGVNFGKYVDPMLTDLFDRQKAITDVAERKRLVGEFEKQVVSQAYVAPLYWVGRTVAIPSNIHGWTPTPSFFLSFDLTEIWRD